MTVTSPPIFHFPPLRPGWSVHWMPTWASIVSTHTSGREVITPLQAYPLHEFTLTYELLEDETANQSIFQPAAPYTELQQLAGLFMACTGQYGYFYYDFESDNSRSAAAVGTGNGVTTIFTVFRSFGPQGFSEPVGGINVLSEVYFNGVAQPATSYSKSGNQIIFNRPPGNGLIITADFSFWFLCRFIEDQQDYEQFMYNLWKMSSLKFRSVKP
jgi:hypothetical protein